MKNLFIVIVSFKGGKDLFKLIESLGKEKVSGWVVKLIVVDNGPDENIKYQISNIKIIQNKRNLGFAAGLNVGIKYALENNAHQVLLLNQDVVIEQGFIKSLIDNPADIVSPVIKFKRDNKWVYDYGGRINWLIGRTYHIELTEKIMSFRAQPRNLSRMRDSNSNKLRDLSTSVGMTKIDYVSGCCLLVKTEVFEKIGLLDGRFFLYFEDVDYCLRAQKEGFKIAVEPKSIIFHNLKEGKQKSFFKKWHLLRSNAIFINKYLGFKQLLGYLYLLALMIKMVL